MVFLPSRLFSPLQIVSGVRRALLSVSLPPPQSSIAFTMASTEAAAAAAPPAEAASPAVVPAAGATEVRDWPWKRAKKVALMMSFSGKNYLGMQRNQGFATIEDELLKALLAAGAIPQEWFDNPQKSFFQRASRTDKGVSAAKMVVSLRMLDDPDTIPRINSHLPAEIRVQDAKRVTKNFNSKNSCDARTYLYMTPTFAFCPLEQTVTEGYRIDAAGREKVNKVLEMFIGSKYYHNYTSGKLPMEPSSQRFITTFTMGEPFVRDDLEFAVITVKGQSFMLHQIRKMIGMTMAVVRGFASESTIEETWKTDRIDVPRAPGLGLMLDEVHYERYNQRFGSDGIHEALNWAKAADAVESFKDDLIFPDIVETEKKEKSMLEWMKNLPIHTFEPRHFESEEGESGPLHEASKKVSMENRQKQKEEKNGSIVEEKTATE